MLLNMAKGDSNTPSWLPSWMPDKTTVDYISGSLTALLLLLVGLYLILHFRKGGNTSHAATVAAGVGVGGAGT